MKKSVFLLVLSVLSGFVFAQTDLAQKNEMAEENEVQILPEVTVKAQRDSNLITPNSGDTYISQEDMARDNVRDLWEAIRYVPGVVVSGGGRRNDSGFSIRGFDSSRVPVFVDGIMQSNPYRGSGDAARMLTGDLESISIQKGYSSRLLGANMLGGAVLMRMAKPREAFEGGLEISQDFDRSYEASAQNYVASLGSRQTYYYVKGTYQKRDVDHFLLPKNFTPSQGNPQQDGKRLFSDSNDSKYSLIAGITPNENLDIWVGHILQDSDKGVSPPETTIPNYVIWDWTKWRRESTSVASTYQSEHFDLEAMFYYDQYDNALNEYAGDLGFLSYQYGIHSPTSVYDESTVGGRIVAGWRANEQHQFQLATTLKHEKHDGYRGGDKEVHIVEDTLSFGAEYRYHPTEKLTLLGGMGYDELKPRSYWGKRNDLALWMGEDDYVVNPQSHWLYAGQIGGYYAITENHEVRLTYARKNRFPTMSERYSTRYCREIPNPGLLPEIADHVELGYQGNVGMVSINTAVYQSQLSNKIVVIGWPDPSRCSGGTILADVYTNLDEATFYGYEFSGEAFINEQVLAGGAFSLNRYQIDASADRLVKVVSYYPETTASAYLTYSPTYKLNITPRIEYTASRWADAEGHEQLGSYTLVHLKATYEWNDHLSLSLYIHNLSDQLYEIRQFYPQSGRSFSLSMGLRF